MHHMSGEMSTRSASAPHFLLPLLPRQLLGAIPATYGYHEVYTHAVSKLSGQQPTPHGNLALARSGHRATDAEHRWKSCCEHDRADDSPSPWHCGRPRRTNDARGGTERSASTNGTQHTTFLHSRRRRRTISGIATSICSSNKIEVPDQIHQPLLHAST